MSAAVDNFKKGWLLAVFSLASSVIVLVVGQGMQNNAESQRIQDEKLSLKADKAYVDQRFEEYEKLQKAHYQGIYDMFSITKDQIKELREDIRGLKR